MGQHDEAVSFGREFLQRFADALEGARPPDVPAGALSARVFEVISEEEAGEVAMRHLAPAAAPFVLAYVQLHGSVGGIDDAAVVAGLRHDAAMRAIFEETAALFRARTGEE